MLTNFLTALQLLTIIRIKKDLPFEETAIGRSAIFFPLIGLLIGALVWGADRVLRPVFPTTILSIILVGLLAALSRGFHLDGVADSADGLFGSRSPAIMKDGTHATLGTCGVLALFFILMFKVRALDLLLGGYRDIALLLGPMLGRWACVVMAYSSRPARDEGLGTLFVHGVQFNEFALSSLIALGVLFTLIEIVGIALVLPLGGLIIGFTLFCNRRLGGVTGENWAAVGELVETAALCLFVLLAGGGAVTASS